MWKSTELGVAIWQSDHRQWLFDLRGASQGVGIVDGESLDAPRWVSFLAVGTDQLPTLDEQFVRGDELHLHYPQGEGVIEMRLVVRPVHDDGDSLVVEVTVAIQTDQLDSHPRIDLAVGSSTPTANSKAATSVSRCESAGRHTAVLLDQHDCPFTENVSTDDQLVLRLFGQFLEKGVIRKARPWIVLGRSEASIQPARLGDLQIELANQPLPLRA